MLDQRKKAVFALFIVSLCWSLGGLLIKLVAWDPLAIAGMRSAIAIPVLWVFRRHLAFTWTKAQLTAAIAYAAVVILFVTANKNTTAANAVLLQYTSPVFVALISRRVLNERIKLIDWLTAFAVLMGIGLFFVDQLSWQGRFGNICSIVGGFAFAVFAVSMRLQKEASPIESVVLGNAIAAAFGLAFSSHSFAGLENWGLIFLLGTVQLGLPYVLYSFAVKHVTAIEVVLIPALEPIVNPLLVLLFLKEAPTPWAIVGGAMVFSAVIARGSIAAGKRSAAGQQ